jgi:branched-chain amino acid transport system ATP-binding protein
MQTVDTQPAPISTIDAPKQGLPVTIITGFLGSGKTTLLRTISRLIKQRRGNIILDGASIDDSQVHQVVRRGISHIPEGRGLLAEMTVIENLRLGSHVNSGSYLAEDLDKIHQLFPVLLERQNQQAGMLSGGEQQMLAIARGLLARPRLLLID